MQKKTKILELCRKHHTVLLPHLEKNGRSWSAVQFMDINQTGPQRAVIHHWHKQKQETVIELEKKLTDAFPMIHCVRRIYDFEEKVSHILCLQLCNHVLQLTDASQELNPESLASLPAQHIKIKEFLSRLVENAVCSRRAVADILKEDEDIKEEFVHCQTFFPKTAPADESGTKHMHHALQRDSKRSVRETIHSPISKRTKLDSKQNEHKPTTSTRLSDSRKASSSSQEKRPSSVPASTIQENLLKKPKIHQTHQPQQASAHVSGPSSLPIRMAYAPILRVHSISRRLQEFMRQNFDQAWECKSFEAGGGGDCLFHSLGAILENMMLDPASADHVRSVLPEQIFDGTRTRIVQHLRNVCANQWRFKEPWKVLNYLLAGAQRENMIDGWLDLWSPTEKLLAFNFGELIGQNDVCACGPDPLGEIGDLAISVVATDPIPGRPVVHDVVRIPNGDVLYEQLLESLLSEFSKCGNIHWADSTDLKTLSEHLQIGVLLFADNLQDEGRKCLASLDQCRGDFPYFVSIWWQDPVHFRMAKLKFHADDSLKCVWPSTALPPVLRDHYNDCNQNAHIGVGPRAVLDLI